MCLITFALFSIWLLKITAIYKAIRWVSINGFSYKQYISDHPPSNSDDYYSAFEKNKGVFFPFGMKDFKLRMYTKKSSSYSLLRFFQNFLFNFNRLTFITCAYLLISTNLNHLPFFSNFFGQKNYFLCVLAVIMLIGNILLSIEAIYSCAIIGNYARHFHMLSYKKDFSIGESPLLLELKVFFIRLVTTIISSSLTCYVSHIFFDAFTGKIAVYQPLNPLNWFQILFQSIYFAATTLFTVGYGDISPNNEIGQLISLLIMLQGFLLVVVVFASIMSIRFDSAE
jgi:Ion channel